VIWRYFLFLSYGMLQPLNYSALSEFRCTQLSCTAFYWSIPHPTELHCTLLSYTTPCWVTPQNLLNYAALFWATLHVLSNAAPYWATGHSIELCCTLLSYISPYLAALHPTKLWCAALYWAKVHHAMLHCILKHFQEKKLMCAKKVTKLPALTVMTQ
jgi:hypothetical protein